MDNHSENKMSAKEAQKAVMKKFTVPMILAYLLLFPVMFVSVMYELQFIFNIYCSLLVLFVCYALKKRAIAGGSTSKYSLWWLPGVILLIIVTLMTYPVNLSLPDTAYERAEKTFDSWIDTDPNTWTNAQTDYFNDLMDHAGN